MVNPILRTGIGQSHLFKSIVNPREMNHGTEYEVLSRESLLIPFGSLRKLNLTCESEVEEGLALEPFISALGSFDAFEDVNEPLFTNACLENVETERIGDKIRKTYDFEFKRVSLHYSPAKRLSLFWRQCNDMKIGDANRTDPRFLEFLPEVPLAAKSELKQMSGNLAVETPVDLALRIYDWVRGNFEYQEDSATHLNKLIEQKKENGKFCGDCYEYSEVFSNTMRAYGIPTTIAVGKTDIGHECAHTWSEVCVSVKEGETCKTRFLPIDSYNEKFGNINEKFLYYSVIPLAERKTPHGKETQRKNFKLTFS